MIVQGSLTVAAISGISAGIFLALLLIVSCGLCVRLKFHQKCTTWIEKLFCFRNNDDDEIDLTAGQTPEEDLPRLQEVESCFEKTAASTKPEKIVDRVVGNHNPLMIQFSLYYNFHENRLNINIICALNVPLRWHGRSPKTQVRFQLLPDIDNMFHTEIATGGRQPIFNECFEFIGYNSRDLLDITMRVGVYVFDAFSRSKLLGYACVHFEDIDWDPSEMNILWRNLRSPDIRDRTSSFLNGRQLHVSLRYQARSNRISVIILKGINLVGPSKIKIIAPYIRVMLSLDGKILETQQTKRKRTTNPVWNKGFLFDIDSKWIQDYVITIRVMNYDMLLSDESIGQVVLSADSGGRGQEHWHEMMKGENINRETAMCHYLT